jgi:hypothetical protein
VVTGMLFFLSCNQSGIVVLGGRTTTLRDV